jgi:hypothetical protein
VIALTSTFPASALSEADAVVRELKQIRLGVDGARMLAISIE